MPVADRPRHAIVAALALAVLVACATPSPRMHDAIDVPFVRQVSQSGCGVAALTSVMQFHTGAGIDQRDLLARYPAANPGEGYSLGELRAIAHAQGFEAFVIAGDEGFLARQLALGRPLVVPVHATPRVRRSSAPSLSGFLTDRFVDRAYNHYLVVLGIDDDHIALMDPARGPIELERSLFVEYWSNMDNAVLIIGFAKGGYP